MKADVRISIKDYSRKKNLKILLFRPPYPGPQFLVSLNGAPWPVPGQPVSLTRLFAALRKALVRSSRRATHGPASPAHSPGICSAGDG